VRGALGCVLAELELEAEFAEVGVADVVLVAAVVARSRGGSLHESAHSAPRSEVVRRVMAGSPT
jgi:hypothetical protein